MEATCIFSFISDLIWARDIFIFPRINWKNIESKILFFIYFLIEQITRWLILFIYTTRMASLMHTAFSTSHRHDVVANQSLFVLNDYPTIDFMGRYRSIRCREPGFWGERVPSLSLNLNWSYYCFKDCLLWDWTSI